MVITAQQPVPAYTNCDIQLQNVAPDDGLKSPKHVEHLMINKDSLQEFVHLVGLLIYTLQYDARCIQLQIPNTHGRFPFPSVIQISPTAGVHKSHKLE